MMNKKLGRTLSRSELRGVKGGANCAQWCEDENECSCLSCEDECKDACEIELGPDTCTTDCCIEEITTCCN